MKDMLKGLWAQVVQLMKDVLVTIFVIIAAFCIAIVGYTAIVGFNAGCFVGFEWANVLTYISACLLQ